MLASMVGQWVTCDLQVHLKGGMIPQGREAVRVRTQVLLLFVVVVVVVLLVCFLFFFFFFSQINSICSG